MNTSDEKNTVPTPVKIVNIAEIPVVIKGWGIAIPVAIGIIISHILIAGFVVLAFGASVGGAASLFWK